MHQQIAFLGTGIMGEPMCGHLLDAGYPVRAWNRSADKLKALAQRGAVACDTPAEAVRGADFVIVMLSSGPVVDSVLFSPNATGECLADEIERGAIVVVMSSIPVGTARQHEARLAERGIAYIDAPVSGGEKGALEAKLVIMAGGESAVVEQARPLLEIFGRLTHVGPAGSGQLAKLANQTIVGITIDAVAEALLLAEAGGADPAAVRTALMGGFADSTILTQHGERMITRQFKPGGKAEVQLKDLRTSRELADSLGLDLPLLKCAEALFQDMCDHGDSQLDHSGIYLEIARRSKRL
jgi:3-hydroxyisobutyrate dehydrogenase-like beta-hydroxyacid dehydrogenase